MQNIINKKDQELISLKNELNNKNEELNNLKLNNRTTIYSSKDGKPFAVNFTTPGQNFLIPKICKNNDTIVRLEEQVYNEYPKYKDYNTYLTCNGKVLKRFKTFKENEITAGSAIIINTYDQQ